MQIHQVELHVQMPGRINHNGFDKKSTVRCLHYYPVFALLQQLTNWDGARNVTRLLLF